MTDFSVFALGDAGVPAASMKAASTLENGGTILQASQAVVNNKGAKPHRRVARLMRTIWRRKTGPLPGTRREKGVCHVLSEPDTESIVEQWCATHLTTWTRFHMQLNPDEKVLPLKVDSLLTIVKTMRECGYKSTRNYLATMTRAHIKGDWPWPGSLSVAYRDAARSAITRPDKEGEVFRNEANGISLPSR